MNKKEKLRQQLLEQTFGKNAIYLIYQVILMKLLMI